MFRKKKFVLELQDGFQIDSKIKESDLLSNSEIKKETYETGYLWFSLPESYISNELIITRLCFNNSKLLFAEFFLVNPTNIDYSESIELDRLKRTKKWLKKIGYSGGKYSWGNITVSYDSKSGFSSALVTFAI